MSTNEQHSPAYKLFYYNFYCRVPAIHTMTDTYIRERGVITTGNKERDLAMANAPIDIYTTIRQMVEYHKEGVPITLTNPEDSVRIYDIITEFLNQYNQALDNSYNVTIQDKDFFRNLDNFAREVYKIARMYIPQQATRGGLFENLEKLGRRSIIKRSTEAKVKMEKEHKSISDQILKKSSERDKKWR